MLGFLLTVALLGQDAKKAVVPPAAAPPGMTGVAPKFDPEAARRKRIATGLEARQREKLRAAQAKRRYGDFNEAMGQALDQGLQQRMVEANQPKVNPFQARTFDPYTGQVTQGGMGQGYPGFPGGMIGGLGPAGPGGVPAIRAPDIRMSVPKGYR